MTRGAKGHPRHERGSWSSVTGRYTSGTPWPVTEDGLNTRRGGTRVDGVPATGAEVECGGLLNVLGGPLFKILLFLWNTSF